ncbi:MAG: guanylate kinase [Bacteroidota bacterium]
MQGKLLLFCGPSGSGKTTIVHHLLKHDARLTFSVSATTRPIRANEKDGADYHFLSVNDFKKLIRENAFIEWEEVYTDRFYGTLRSEIDRIWKARKVAVFDVDVEGGLKIKSIFGDRLLSVFVMPPSVEELRRRLHTRNSETAESYKARISKAEHELTYAFRFDKTIVNDSLGKALSDAEDLVNDFLLDEMDPGIQSDKP